MRPRERHSRGLRHQSLGPLREAAVGQDDVGGNLAGGPARRIRLEEKPGDAQGNFFFPCVTEGARLYDLPEEAREFQGVDLQQENGMRDLVDALIRVCDG